MDNGNSNFKEIFLKSPAGIIFYDKEGNLVNANSSALKITGIPKLEYIEGSNIFDNPDIAPKREKLINEGSLKFQLSIDFENIRKTGFYGPTRSGIAYLDYVIFVINSGYLVQIQDITEYKHNEELKQKALEESQSNSEELQVLNEELHSSNEELQSTTEELRVANEELQQQSENLINLNQELQESKEHYQQFFDNPLTGFALCEIITDDNGKPVDFVYLQVNDTFEKFTGLKKEDVLNKKVTDILPIEEVDPAIKIYGGVALTRKSEQFEINIHSLDKTYDIVAFSPQKMRFIAMFNDITKRKKSEEKNKRILENIAESYVEYDNKWRYVDVNTKTEELVGLKKDELVSKIVWELFPQFIGTKQYTEFHKSKKENIPVRFESKSLISKSWYEIHTYPHPEGLSVYSHNITERKKAEKDLKESKTKLEVVIESMTDAVFVSDVDGNFIDFNEAFAAYHKFKDKEEAYKTLSEYPDYIDVYFADGTLAPLDMWAVPRALRGETAYNEEYMLRRKDTGEKWWGSYSFAPIKDNEGKISGSVVVGRDISERKQFEEALRKSETQFKILIRNLRSGVALIDETGKFTIVNPAFLQMFNLDTKLNILNVNSQNWSRWEVYGEDGNLLHVDDHPVRKVAITGEPVKNHLVGLKNPWADKLTWMLISAEPMQNKESSENMIICTYHDITQRKQAEEELRQARDNLELKVEERTAELYAERQRLFDVLETLPVMICLLTPDYHVAFANRAFREKFGESNGRPCYEYCFGFTEPCDFCQSYKVLETGKPHHWEVKGQDGTIIDAYDFPFTDIDGSPLILEMDIDITEQRQSQDALEKAHDELKDTVKELERSNQELQQFAYVSSHDLQEPLRMVTSYLQLLERRYKGEIDDKADRYINFAVDGALRMQNLIDDLLAFSRVTTHANEFESVDSELILNGVLSNLDVLIKENGAVITHDPLPTIMADSTQLSQVFQNLISNAIKFRSEENPEIHISAKKEDNKWMFSVADNGIGIDPKHSERIFEVFKRLHTRREYPGTGIGLSIVKRIIERHGGEIWVKSKLGKCSTFYFTLSKPE